MKLSDLAAKPIKIELKHPTTAEPLGVFITIVGKNSKQFKDKFYDTVNQTQADIKDMSNGDKIKVAEQRSAELIASCIVGWDDIDFFDGSYTPEAALAIIAKPELVWVKDQVENSIVEDGIFFIK